jgi:hypothetical protein
VRQDDPIAEVSRKALARRHQRLVQRYVPLMAALLITGSFALFILAETYFGPSSYHRHDRRDRDDGISTAVAHAVIGVFRAIEASDSTICFVFAFIAISSFLTLGGIAWMLWLRRPAGPCGGAR